IVSRSCGAEWRLRGCGRRRVTMGTRVLHLGARTLGVWPLAPDNGGKMHARATPTPTVDAPSPFPGMEHPTLMATPRSDALVFFGATGDLAYKKIFPALQALTQHGELDIPIIGVAHSGWSVAKLRQRAHESLVQAAKDSGGT